MMQAPVQARVMSLVQQSVKYHAGHVITPGVTYQLVEPRIYGNWALISTIDGRGAAQFVIKAVAAYFVEPLPNHVQTRLLWAYVPEHVIWLVMMLLVPVGVIAGVKRDRGLTAILLAHDAGQCRCAVVSVSRVKGSAVHARARQQDHVPVDRRRR